MKLFVLLLFLFLQSSSVFGQHHIIGSNRKERVLYVGLDNTIEFLLENASCKKYLLTSNDIIITPDENPCTFTVKPEQPGTVKVLVKDRKTKKTVFEAKFNVVTLPPPTIRFAGQSKGNVVKAAAKAQVGLIASLDGFDISTRFEVARFLVIIVRNEQVVYSMNNVGAVFSKEVKNGLQNTQAGDKLIFANATYNGPSQHSGNLKPAEFTIVE